MMKHLSIFFILFAVLVSCNGHDPDEQDTTGRFVTSVSVSCQQPQAASGITRAEDDDHSIIAEDDDHFIIIDQFRVGDKLYFSQLPPTGTPNFTDPESTDNPLYIYRYDGRSAEWSDGYNFSLPEDAKNGTSPIFDWRTVKEIGSVGNAFSLYAMYFPGDNEYRLNIETDQRGPEENRYDTSNFVKSDIMGAYHATSSLYTRLRFRLFHLMVYLKVKLYVPVLDTQSEDGNVSYSGFKEGAVQSAQVLNVSTQLNIEWRANRSSDTEAPLTQQATEPKATIFMYGHEPDEEKIETIEIADYYTNEPYGKDQVRTYEFSVLFPMQTVGDNFLCFTLQSPYSGDLRYYYFSGSQIVGDKSESYGLTQGTRQELHLYLPRKTNETVLVGAKILPWLPADTEMTVTKDPQGND